MKRRKKWSFTSKEPFQFSWQFLLGCNLFQKVLRVLPVAVKKPSTSYERKSMTEKIDWKHELLDSANFNGKQVKILKNGGKSLTDSWILGSLYTIWKKLEVSDQIQNHLIAIQVFRNGIRM